MNEMDYFEIENCPKLYFSGLANRSPAWNGDLQIVNKMVQPSVSFVMSFKLDITEKQRWVCFQLFNLHLQFAVKADGNLWLASCC